MVRETVRFDNELNVWVCEVNPTQPLLPIEDPVLARGKWQSSLS